MVLLSLIRRVADQALALLVTATQRERRSIIRDLLAVQTQAELLLLQEILPTCSRAHGQRLRLDLLRVQVVQAQQQIEPHGRLVLRLLVQAQAAILGLIQDQIEQLPIVVHVQIVATVLTLHHVRIPTLLEHIPHLAAIRIADSLLLRGLHHLL